MGFEPKIPLFERAVTVHASDRAATLIAMPSYTKENKQRKSESVLQKIFLLGSEESI
jgi:hypothetical protein